MEIPNLASDTPVTTPTKPISLPILAIVVVLALTLGFWVSRIAPSKTSTKSNGTNTSSDTANVIPADEIKSKDQIKVGQTYGDTGKEFKDVATGTIEKGSINGEGTHILNRQGGITQRASLTSSSIDLDLFIGHKVEVKGETNSSKKTGWLMDVGTVNVLE